MLAVATGRFRCPQADWSRAVNLGLPYVRIFQDMTGKIRESFFLKILEMSGSLIENGDSLDYKRLLSLSIFEDYDRTVSAYAHR
jgi:hypothetical protein